MKKILLKHAIVLCSICLSFLKAQDKEVIPYFYELISNPSKTINYAIGVYPTRSEYVRKPDGSGYTKMRVAVINYANQDLSWNDYKIYILMKNGDLFYNYLTSAQEGELSCKYSVKPNETHIQYVCFEKEFNINLIDRVYLCLLDNNFIPLLYTDGKQNTK